MRKSPCVPVVMLLFGFRSFFVFFQTCWVRGHRSHQCDARGRDLRSRGAQPYLSLPSYHTLSLCVCLSCGCVLHVRTVCVREREKIQTKDRERKRERVRETRKNTREREKERGSVCVPEFVDRVPLIRRAPGLWHAGSGHYVCR